MKSIICIPTYNESENISLLIQQIFQFEPNVSILIIEDNSPDGTGEIVNNLMKKNPKLHCIHRKGKLGLASAYIEAFKFAIDNNFDSAVSMDADFSHDPKYLSVFFNLANTHDFIIGSRYVANGGTKNWGFHRQLISRGGNLYANMFLRTPFNDLTGGFNCYKTNVLKSIKLNTIQSQGYCFQVEMKYRCYFKGYKGIETPIIFEDRKVGKSKMSSKIMIEAMLKVPTLKYKVLNSMN